MKNISRLFAVIGMISGVLFALGPFLLGTPSGSVISFLAPVLFGKLLIATHWHNFKCFRGLARSSSKTGLLTVNLLLLGFLLLAFVDLYRFGTSFPHMPLVMAAFVLLWPLPLAVNVICLCLPSDVATADTHAATSA